MGLPQGKKSDAFDRVPPSAVEAEMAVLGAILIEPRAITRAIEVIGTEAFYRGAHRKIYLAMLNLFERDEAIDILTISDEMNRDGTLEKIGGRLYLASLLDTVATAAHITYHANLIKEKWVRRELIRTGTEIVQKSYDQADEVDVLLDKAEQSIFEISENRLSQGFQRVKPIVSEVVKKIDLVRQGGLSALGLASGYRELDSILSGFQNSDLIIFAGRPSMGKTAFALNIAQNVALQSKRAVGIFSLEMSNDQLVNRLICSDARLSSYKVRNGRLSSAEWQKLVQAANSLYEAPIFIDDSPMLNVLEMRAKARRLAAEHDLSLLIVDYLQLMTGGGRHENRQQEISHISRSLKALAKELRIPVVALSQLSRAVEMRNPKDKRPVLSDLRESGAIEQDADVVIFLFREEVYNPDDESLRNRAELLIRKHRNGQLGTVKLTFIKDFMRFEDPAPDAYFDQPVYDNDESEVVPQEE